MSLRRTLALLSVVAGTACVQHVPSGFSSETRVSWIDIPCSHAAVAGAIRDELVARSRSYEEERDDAMARFRFSRGQVVTRALDPESARLEVRLLEYTGPDAAIRADALRDAIVARALGGDDPAATR